MIKYKETHKSHYDTPRSDVEKWLLAKDKQVLELVQLPLSGPFIQVPSLDDQNPPSILLFINKESMQADPINWDSFKTSLSNWACTHHLKILIPDWTDKLFLERVSPSHKPRASSEGHESDCVYKFIDPFAKKKNETNHFIENGIPAHEATLINSANRHNYALSTLGILPNQIRTILRIHMPPKESEEAWNDISKSLFWAGYNIWKKRKKLTSKFWNEIAPKEWNEQRHKKKKKKKKKVNPSQCLDPFHFLTKTNDFTKQKITKCPCSLIKRQSKNSKSRDIRTLLNRFPTIHFPNVHDTNSPRLSSSFQLKRFKTRVDEIRDQHDRGKRRRKT